MRRRAGARDGEVSHARIHEDARRRGGAGPEDRLDLGAALAVIALAALVYAAKTAFGPLATLLGWLFAYTRRKANDIVAGLSFGARMLAWASVVGAVVWIVYQWWGFSS